jgi:hypothetical protein
MHVPLILLGILASSAVMYRDHLVSPDVPSGFVVDYQVNIDRPIYVVSDTDVTYRDANNMILTAPYDHHLDIGDLVSLKPGTGNDFLGSITTKNDSHLVATRYQLIDVIKSGNISIKHQGALGSTGEYDVPLCFGFNTDKSCHNPLSPIVFFSNEIIDVVCDQCYAGISAILFMDIEFSEFRLSRLRYGLKQLDLRGELGMTASGHNSWSYDYNRVYEILNQQQIVAFNIGPLAFSIFVDFPIEVEFRAQSAAAESVSYGVQLDVNLGDLYVEYSHGQWQIVKSTPVTTVDPYLHESAELSGDAHFAVTPKLVIYSPQIFSMDLIFNPSTDLTVGGSLASKNLCIKGTYDFDVVFGGSILKEPIPSKTLYDTGTRLIGQKCLK